MNKFYTFFAALIIVIPGFTQQLDFEYPSGQHLVTYVENVNIESPEIKINTPTSEAITYEYEMIQNTLNQSWVVSLCDYNSCYVGLPDSATMTPISQADADNGIYGFYKVNVTVGQTYGQGMVSFYVYDSTDYNRGDTISWEIIWILAGDSDGDGLIGIGEIAGDTDNDGVINGSEIAGDFNGNGILGSGEIAGDLDGDGDINGGELVGDINGDGVIGTGEIEGDSNGNGILDNNEITSIAELSAENIYIYPNPAVDFININGDNLSSFIVYDLHGKLMNRTEVISSKNRIEVSNFEAGTYFILLETADGNSTTRKFTIK